MILEALVNTLEQPHMQSVTTKILAEKCDITESALYKHYKNKQEIFEQLFRHVEQTIMAVSYTHLTLPTTPYV